MNSSCVVLSPSTMSVIAFTAMSGIPNIRATCATPAASISLTLASFFLQVFVVHGWAIQGVPRGNHPCFEPQRVSQVGAPCRVHGADAVRVETRDLDPAIVVAEPGGEVHVAHRAPFRGEPARGARVDQKVRPQHVTRLVRGERRRDGADGIHPETKRGAVDAHVHGRVPHQAGEHHRGKGTREWALLLFLQPQALDKRRRFSLHCDEHGDGLDTHRAVFLFTLLVKRSEDHD
mmetsp:Transcript_3243/g.11276  ORF Transcript_3243/g.11276 Transcript_3243/m.11276 type:complete len:233 (-) Transcript_3243:39-737(-)